MRAVAEAKRASLIPCDNDEEDEPLPIFNLSPIVCSPFSLPTASLYNIFHPSDPVAYRIEPLLLPEGVECPSPKYLSPDGETVRLHIKARQVGDQLMKGIGSFRDLFEKPQTEAEVTNGINGKKDKIKDSDVKFKLGGNTSRVDHQLQLGVIDNEYISAVTAHSSYFSNEDIIDFIIFNTRSNDGQKNT